MNVSNRLVMWMLICAGVAIGTGQWAYSADPKGAMQGKPKMMASSILVTEVVVTKRGDPKGSWRHLQRYEIHLTEKLGSAAVDFDCSTDFPVVIDENTHTVTDEGISCEQLAAARKEDAYAKLKDIKTLKYTMLTSNWSNSLDHAFTDARVIANAEEVQSAVSGETPAVLDMDVTATTISALPACIPPYASPCYVRPQCVSLGKCSKVSTGCQACSY